MQFSNCSFFSHEYVLCAVKWNLFCVHVLRAIISAALEYFATVKQSLLLKVGIVLLIVLVKL